MNVLDVNTPYKVLNTPSFIAFWRVISRLFIDFVQAL